MTNEEAWYNVKQGRSIPHKKETLAKIRELIEQKPCEDAISRQAVLDAIYDADCGYDRNFELDHGMCNKADLAKNVENLPPVQPKAKTGKWIDKMYDFKYCSAECDKCHQRALGSGSDNGWGYDYAFPDYCPNCGAKMEGVVE